jgi:hypothetical protein
MRLVLWNTLGRLTADRTDRLHSLAPDVAVLPEADPSPTWRDEHRVTGFEWQGEHERKGLGVAAFGSTTIVPREERRSPWVLPVEVSHGTTNWTLLAVWVVGAPGTPSYPKQVAQIIEAYADDLASGSTVLAGDLNSSANTADNRQHLRNVARLAEMGVVSAYHAHRGTDPDRSDSGTLFWQWKEHQPYHCDLAFVPEAWAPRIRSVTLGTYSNWVATKVSDHVPVVVDVDPEAER